MGGAAALTKTERRLLNAIAVAQSRPELLDNYVCKLAPDRARRGALAEAVQALADGLAALGYRLPLPPRVPGSVSADAG